MPRKVVPAVIVLICFSAGIFIDALNNHLSAGAFVGLTVGVVIGLIVLLNMRKAPHA
jgi:hypothetical protein